MSLVKLVKRLGLPAITAVLISALSFQSVGALGGIFDPAMYSGNNIQFYNPQDLDCTTIPGIKARQNKDYLGKDILTTAQLKAVSENKPFYKKAADTSGIPWELLAAIHYRETGFKRYGPSNGGGPYQISEGGYPVKDAYTDAEFQDATDKAAAFILAKSEGKNLSEVNNVKYTIFAYNGTSTLYKDQAKALGFSDAEANNGEGSPYVMNRADTRRDSTITTGANRWGQIKSDGGSLEYPANSDYGAFVVYASLAQIHLEGGCNGSLVKGGMTKEQADAFMEIYKTSSDSVSFVRGAGLDNPGGPLANCTSFSSYFVNKYTTLSYNSGNGGNVVQYMVNGSWFGPANEGLQMGTEPQPYAIFSTFNSGDDAGHTGVVLGVYPEQDQIIIGEAAWGRSMDWVQARVYSLAKWSDGSVTYAYAADFLKDEVRGDF